MPRSFLVRGKQVNSAFPDRCSGSTDEAKIPGELESLTKLLKINNFLRPIFLFQKFCE